MPTPTLEEIRQTEETARQIVRRIRKRFNGNGEGMERQVLNSVIADAEIQALLRNEASRDALVLAFLDHVVWFDEDQEGQEYFGAIVPWARF